MKASFADTAYFLALLNAKDKMHNNAVELTKTLEGRIITTTWVLTEVVDALSHPPNRVVAIAFVSDLKADNRVTILPPNQGLFDAGLDLFSRRRDKEWSLTDCISFVAMDRHCIRDALTSDRHFEQAGFHIKMATDPEEG